MVVSTSDPTPPYEQLRKQFTDLIHSGVLAPGDRLPPLRQLARDLGLAVGTVARTYRELEAEGLLTSRRGGGTRVADNPPRLAKNDRRQRLDDLATNYLHHTRQLGVDDQAALDAVRNVLG
nr:GntR family transcriptional regulator [Streptomyces sp. SID13031]